MLLIGLILLHAVLDFLLVHHLKTALPKTYERLGGRRLYYSLPVQADFFSYIMLVKFREEISDGFATAVAWMQFLVNWLLLLLLLFLGIRGILA